LAHKKDFGAALGDEGSRRDETSFPRRGGSVEDNIWMVIPEWSYVEKSWI